MFESDLFDDIALADRWHRGAPVVLSPRCAPCPLFDDIAALGRQDGAIDARDPTPPDAPGELANGAAEGGPDCAAQGAPVSRFPCGSRAASATETSLSETRVIRFERKHRPFAPTGHPPATGPPQPYRLEAGPSPAAQA